MTSKRQIANFRILDVGAGKGRFASALRRMYPSEDFEVFATDLSDKMLSFVPDNIQAFQASVTSLPFPDNYFDVVFAIEVLEHVPIYEHAIVEIKRVLKPSGRIIIIDKNAADPRAELWALDPWEQWFYDEDMLAVLKKYQFQNLQSSNIGYEHVTVPDGLFFAWTGTKFDNHTKEINNKAVIYVVIGTQTRGHKTCTCRACFAKK